MPPVSSICSVWTGGVGLTRVSISACMRAGTKRIHSACWSTVSVFDVGFVVAQNMRMHFGYNLSGFEDEDFRSARYTAQGPFVRFSLKLDQASLRDILRR